MEGDRSSKEGKQSQSTKEGLGQGAREGVVGKIKMDEEPGEERLGAYR